MGVFLQRVHHFHNLAYYIEDHITHSASMGNMLGYGEVLIWIFTMGLLFSPLVQ